MEPGPAPGPGPGPAPGPGPEPDDDNKYVVAAIVGRRWNNQPTGGRKAGVEYLVRWTGYGPNADTWEPIEELDHARPSIADYDKYAAAKAMTTATPSLITSCEPRWHGPPVRTEGERAHYQHFSLGDVFFELGDFVYLNGGDGHDPMIGRIEQLFEITGSSTNAPGATDPTDVPAAARDAARPPSTRPKTVPAKVREAAEAKKVASKDTNTMTAAEAECPMFVIVRWCFRFADCFEGTVISEDWNWGSQLEAERSFSIRSEIFLS